MPTNTLETADTGIEIKSNLTNVMTLAPGMKSAVKRVNKKGRPCIHPFAGRITLLREEVEFALAHQDVFIEMMNQAHAFDEERYLQLLAEGIISTEFTEMYYTFQGPIKMVMEEMQAVADRYEEQVQSGKAEIRFDFHKKKPLADPRNKKKPSNDELALYREPKTQKVDQDIVTYWVEAFPNEIYGYARVRIKNN